MSLSPEVCEQQPPTHSTETAGTEEVPGNDPPRKPPQAEALTSGRHAQKGLCSVCSRIPQQDQCGPRGTTNTELQAGEECRVPLAWLAERERALQWARRVAATPGLLSRTGLPLQAGGVFLLLTQPCRRLRLQEHRSDNRGGR